MAGWLYQCAGMTIVRGKMKYEATDGFLGIDDNRVLTLFGNDGQTIVQAPLASVKVKKGLPGFTPDSVLMEGQRYKIVFRPMKQSMAIAAGGVIGSAIAKSMAGPGDDQRTMKQKRQQFFEVVAA